MMKQKNYLPQKGSRIRSNGLSLLIIFLVIFSSCQKDKFKWKTKKKNTKEQLAQIDSIIVIEGVSKDFDYGYTPKKPIKLGVTDLSLGTTYPEMYFKALRGSENQQVHFRRVKSCCPFKTINSQEYGFNYLAVLEIYELTYEGLGKNIQVYVNFFDEPEKVLAPQGFSYKQF